MSSAIAKCTSIQSMSRCTQGLCKSSRPERGSSAGQLHRLLPRVRIATSRILPFFRHLHTYADFAERARVMQCSLASKFQYARRGA